EAGLLDQLNAHDRVVVKKPAGVVAVGPDAADDGRGVDDDVGAGVVKDLDDGGFFAKVVIGRAGDEDVGRAAFLELADDVAPEEAAAAGDHEPLPGKRQSPIDTMTHPRKSPLSVPHYRIAHVRHFTALPKITRPYTLDISEHTFYS